MALSLDCGYLYYGAHADDAAGNAYPDCTDAFYNAMGTALYEGSGYELKLEAPFIHSNKSDVVREGLRLQVPYELTWSCYEGGGRPCSHCGTCIDRIEAFQSQWYGGSCVIVLHEYIKLNGLLLSSADSPRGFVRGKTIKFTRIMW